MSPIRGFCQIFVLCACSYSVSAIAAQVTTEVKARIRIVDDYMIIVPVTINGSGPYDLVLDTGSNHTILDQELADELKLRRGGETTIWGARASEASSAIYLDSLSIAGATVAGKDLALFTRPNLRGYPRKVRGFLGEDFLQKFDVLIDYRHMVIQLEPGPGSLAETLLGEHLPIQLNGSLGGIRTFGRLIVTAQARDLGENSLSLLLDSGTHTLALFRKSLGVGSYRQTFVDPSASRQSSITALETRTVPNLKLGRSEITDIMVIALGGHSHADVDGLMPTSLFHSIFISHQGRFVILNPSFPKANR